MRTVPALALAARGAPVAALHSCGATSCQINVFVPAKQHSRFGVWTGEPHLIEMVHVNGTWFGPTDHGSPGVPALSASTVHLLDMDAVATWRVGTSQRIALFGKYTTGTVGVGVTNESFTAYVWNGATWAWQPIEAGPGGEDRFVIGDATVVDDGDYDRVGVLMRTASGRIYERAQTTLCGNAGAWTTTHLSGPHIELPPSFP